MRAMLIAISALALAACDNAQVPPPGQEPLRASNPSLADNEVELRAEGLAAGPEAFYYAAGQNEVTTALSKALGEPASETSNQECGAGPMDFVAFPGGVTINFQQGSLVGWTQSKASERITVVGDIQIAMPGTDAASVDGFATVADSTLGQEFSVGRIGGFIEEGAVTMLYAGKQCFFR